MRIILIILYTSIFVFMLYQVLRVWRQLPSRAWNHIGGGMFGIFIVRLSAFTLSFFPEIREMKYGEVTILIAYHTVSLLSLVAVAYGFYVLANNLRHFLSKRAVARETRSETR